MLNIRDLKIDTASLGKPLLLVEVRPYSEYKDGKALEGIAGYRYDVCLVAHRLENRMFECAYRKAWVWGVPVVAISSQRQKYSRGNWLKISRIASLVKP